METVPPPTGCNRYKSVQIGTDTDWAEVAGGFQHAVAIKFNGALWVWGSNDYGQLGNGTTTATIVPTAIPVAGCTLGEETFEQEPFTLYPNPAQNEINIRYQGQQVVTGLVIYDLTGRAVYKTTPVAGNTLQATLPVGMLQSGTYIVSLQANDKTIVAKRFVKE
ncbi:T9SS type A sorting domain-containing protein [Flavobacterium sp.]|uniref:T9SS type A sorting domain-containing protein n=1 Tax=Flavobacterium sp. TaxID=239 RepID=UPI0025CF1988|nr:T9SS type A sorting domain-containing protein [Flavobacterium sp.]